MTTRAERGEVIISVKDSGGGIPQSIRDKVFDPFFTTKDVGRGTGQGLAIAWSIIVEKHHGALTFTVDPEAGTTTFFIRLPVRPIDLGAAVQKLRAAKVTV